MGVKQPEDPGGPSGPIPARPAREPTRGAPARALRSVREAVAGSGPPPTSGTKAAAEARALRGGGAPDAESAVLKADGVEWTVRVRGRGSAGAETGPTPLLVLGFFESAEAASPAREALVVGRSLAAMTDRQLEGAFRVARPPTPSGSKDFFSDAAAKGRKGDG